MRLSLLQFRDGSGVRGVAALGDRFNSGANGETAYPAVPDARALEINPHSFDRNPGLVWLEH